MIAASFDDVIAITGYSIFSSVAITGQGDVAWQIASGPLQVGRGGVCALPARMGNRNSWHLGHVAGHDAPISWNIACRFVCHRTKNSRPTLGAPTTSH